MFHTRVCEPNIFINVPIWKLPWTVLYFSLRHSIAARNGTFTFFLAQLFPNYLRWFDWLPLTSRRVKVFHLQMLICNNHWHSFQMKDEITWNNHEVNTLILHYKVIKFKYCRLNLTTDLFNIAQLCWVFAVRVAMV